MAINETIENGFYRIRNATNTGWRRIALWTKASQVERANGANLEDELEMAYLRENKTVYISPSGSDTTGIGSSGKPYKTFAKALSVTPKNLNGFDVTIVVASGTYTENVTITGFHGGGLKIEIVENANITWNGYFYIKTAGVVNMSAVSGTANILINAAGVIGGITSELDTILRIGNLNMTIDGGGTLNGFRATGSSRTYLVSSNLILNNCVYGIVADNGYLYANAISGVGNTTSMIAQRGGIISYSSETVSSTNGKIVLTGGIITNDLASQPQITALDAKIGAKVIVSAAAPADTSAVWVY